MRRDIEVQNCVHTHACSHEQNEDLAPKPHMIPQPSEAWLGIMGGLRRQNLILLMGACWWVCTQFWTSSRSDNHFLGVMLKDLGLFHSIGKAAERSSDCKPMVVERAQGLSAWPRKKCLSPWPIILDQATGMKAGAKPLAIIPGAGPRIMGQACKTPKKGSNTGRSPVRCPFLRGLCMKSWGFRIY